MRTVVLTTCRNSTEANLLKHKLENNGIACFLANENFADMMPHYHDILGAGVQIRVFEEDDNKAEKLISESYAALTLCPYCQSASIKFGLGTYKLSKLIVVILSIIFWIPMGNIKYSHYCDDCRFEFII